jgi:hypothetical protein
MAGRAALGPVHRFVAMGFAAPYHSQLRSVPSSESLALARISMAEARMHPVTRLIATLALVAACAAPQPSRERTAQPENHDPYLLTIQAIAEDIERLKPEFPQLVNFSAAQHCHGARLEIDYAEKTHRPDGRAGWAGGVPNPDSDGVWFRIDFHAPDSNGQIHTQPVMEDLRFRAMKVTFLMLQGAATKSLHPQLQEILERHGIRPHHTQ